MRPAGPRGLVRQRPHRPAVPAQLLRGGDRRDPGRHRAVRRRRGGHHAGAPGRAARRPRRRGLRSERRRLGGRLLAAARWRSNGGNGGNNNGEGGNSGGSNGGEDSGRSHPTSTPPARRRCRSRCSSSAACRSRSSQPAASDTSRAAARRRTPTTSTATILFRSRRRRREPGGYNERAVRALISLHIADKFSVGTRSLPSLARSHDEQSLTGAGRRNVELGSGGNDGNRGAGAGPGEGDRRGREHGRRRRGERRSEALLHRPRHRPVRRRSSGSSATPTSRARTARRSSRRTSSSRSSGRRRRRTSSRRSTSAAAWPPPSASARVKQMIGRVVDTIGGWGREGGYFATDEEAETFEAELKAILVNQYASFNSPVWFNVGFEEQPQCSACFILSIDDSMESILDWIRREGIIFRGGSGLRRQPLPAALVEGAALEGRLRLRAGLLHARRRRVRRHDQVGRQDAARGEDGRARRRPPRRRGVHLVQGQGGAQGARPRAGRLRHVAELARLGLDPVPEREQLGPRHRSVHGGRDRGQGVEPHRRAPTARSSRRRTRATCSARSPRPRGSAPIRASSTTRRSTRGTRSRTRAASTRRTRARSTCRSTTRRATSPR